MRRYGIKQPVRITFGAGFLSTGTGIFNNVSRSASVNMQSSGPILSVSRTVHRRKALIGSPSMVFSIKTVRLGD